MPELFRYHKSFTLESGAKLPGYHLAYTTHGQLNERRNNAVWVFHALTANSDPAEWWPGLVGSGKIFDPAKYFIICVNMPGSCYGSLGPLDTNPVTGTPYYHNFPVFTPRDMIRAYQPLREALQIESIFAGIGGSMGGQQLLEWAIEEPSLFQYVFPIATNAQHSPWAIAFNASQRMCIELDPTWKENSDESGLEGMKVARSLALLSYRNYETYRLGQSETDSGKLGNFNSESYQRYQGEKLALRFNAYSYHVLGRSMDSHNIGRGREGVAAALQRITANTLVTGISSDLLFPLAEQKELAAGIPNAKFRSIDSTYGHDGFLLEFGQLEHLLREFLSHHLRQQRPVSPDGSAFP